MKIYIHSTENNLILKSLFPCSYEYKFFNNLADINNEDISNSERTFIFCTDDQFTISDIISHFKNILIITSKFLNSHLTKYKHFYSKNTISNLMNNWKVLLIGFEDKNLIIDIQFKIIMMGGLVTLNDMSIDPVDVTHIVIYKMYQEPCRKVNKLFSKCTNIFNVPWIEYYWKRSLSLLNLYDILDSLKEAFVARYFQNCNIHLIGFDGEKLNEMLVTIFDNSGNIYQLNHIHSTDCIIIVPNDFKSEKFPYVFKDMPKDLLKNFVFEDWFWQSVENKSLVKFDEYQVFKSIDCLHTIDTLAENSDHLSPSISMNDFTIQVLGEIDNIDLNHFQFNEGNLSFSLSDREICVDEVERNYDLNFGFDPYNFNEEKFEDNEFRRRKLLKHLSKNIRKKLDLFYNFQALKSHKLIKNSNLFLIFNIFKQITDFFQVFYNIFESILTDYSTDSCFGLELLSHYKNLKKCFQAYNSKFNQMRDLINEIDSNALKEFIQQFADSNQISSFKFFIEIPKRMLTCIQMQLDDIIKSTSKFHPDIAYFAEISQKNKHVTKLMETIEDKMIEGQNQITVMNCIGNPAVIQNENPYRTVVDCMQFYDDGLKIPKSLFFFEKTIVICNFKSSGPNKLFEKVMSHLKEQFNGDNNLSRCPSIQSIYPSSPLKRPNVKRNDSLSSVTTVNSISVRKLEGNACSKFHKLFTGLSKLNWKEKPKNFYCETEILEKCRLLSITSHRGNFDVQSQMFFSIQYNDKISMLPKTMKFFLVPRIVKNPSKYNKINIALPTDFEWEYNDNKEIKWEAFIVEEKRNFCAAIAQHYQIDFMEDSLLSTSMSSIAFENDCFINEKNFTTPIKVDRTMRNVSPSSSFIGSIKQSRSIKNTLSKSFRRLTRFTKISKKNLHCSSFILENEPKLIGFEKNKCPNSKSSDDSQRKNFNEANNFHYKSLTDINSPLNSKENVEFSPNLLVNEKDLEFQKQLNLSNSFIYIDESPILQESSQNDFNYLDKSPNEINEKTFDRNCVNCRNHEVEDSLKFASPINVTRRAVNKRRSYTGSNIQTKNRKF